MHRYTKLLGVVALLAVSATMLVACGDDDDDDDDGDASPVPVEVGVQLSEWSVVPARPEVSSDGPVNFVVENKGPKFAHELVVVKTDLDPADLPTKADGSVDEAGAGITIVGEVEGLDPGATDSGQFELASGSYVLLCNLVEDEADAVAGITAHYQLGMRTAFEVD